MAMKNPLWWRRGDGRIRRVRRARHHSLRDFHPKSPFVRGMARAVDAGGLLREADFLITCKFIRKQSEELARPDADIIAISSDWDALGRHYRHAIGQSDERISLIKAANE